MNTATISKITTRGQITLPKKIRMGGAFVNADAVAFVEHGEGVSLKPVVTQKSVPEHLQIMEQTMRDWLSPEHDNLFDLS